MQQWCRGIHRNLKGQRSEEMLLDLVKGRTGRSWREGGRAAERLETVWEVWMQREVLTSSVINDSTGGHVHTSRQHTPPTPNGSISPQSHVTFEESPTVSTNTQGTFCALVLLRMCPEAVGQFMSLRPFGLRPLRTTSVRFWDEICGERDGGDASDVHTTSTTASRSIWFTWSTRSTRSIWGTLNKEFVAQKNHFNKNETFKKMKRCIQRVKTGQTFQDRRQIVLRGGQSVSCPLTRLCKSSKAPVAAWMLSQHCSLASYWFHRELFGGVGFTFELLPETLCTFNRSWLFLNFDTFQSIQP